MDWFRSRHDLDDERVLIGVTAGVLWIVGAVTAGFAQLIPGADHVDPVLFAGLDVTVFLYGLASVNGWIDWSKVSVRNHAIATAIALPVMGAGLWATGGEHSYLQPVLVLALLHIAYFFRSAVGIPLVGGMLVVAASPLLYEDDLAAGYPPRLFTFGVAGVVLTVVLRLLKSRLVDAEARQRRMALLDALTGLVNRRGFDQALHAAVAARGGSVHGRRDDDERPGFALLVFDLNRFKLVNDTKGHPAGDRLLRCVAANCAAIVREGDTLARIGGDEFAVIAPGAGEGGATRLAAELLEAVRSAGIEATVAWAVHPADGRDGESLLRAADRRLYEGKALVHA
ncbi:MAG: hypothetical protein JWM73_2660 [Solirubrobacterales bacterium]|nr:hypothetical protein [Solirubrobacterales bacterium]